MSLSHTGNNVYGAYLMMVGWKDGQDIDFTCQANIYEHFHIKFPKENFEPTGAPFPGVEVENGRLHHQKVVNGNSSDESRSLSGPFRSSSEGGTRVSKNDFFMY
jgi:hypothetical protein